jgi:hypothetical protein
VLIDTKGGNQSFAAPARVLPQIEESSHSRVRYADPLAASVVKVSYAQFATFAKSVLCPEISGRKRCDAACEPVIGESCSTI